MKTTLDVTDILGEIKNRISGIKMLHEEAYSGMQFGGRETLERLNVIDQLIADAVAAALTALDQVDTFLSELPEEARA